MIEEGRLQRFVDQRYAGWEHELGTRVLEDRSSLADLSNYILKHDVEPEPRSGRQEMLENLVNRYL